MRIGRFLLIGDAGCLVACLAFVPWFPIMAVPALLVGFALYALINSGAWNE